MSWVWPCWAAENVLRMVKRNTNRNSLNMTFLVSLSGLVKHRYSPDRMKKATSYRVDDFSSCALKERRRSGVCFCFFIFKFSFHFWSVLGSHHVLRVSQSRGNRSQETQKVTANICVDTIIDKQKCFFKKYIVCKCQIELVNVQTYCISTFIFKLIWT